MVFACYVIGEGALLIECVQRLVYQGVQIKGIITSQQLTKAFAQEAQIPWVNPQFPLAHTLAQEPFDYLFSIVNPTILPADVLQLPQKGAINYHDSPLPAYAGVHATFWALVAGEKKHGVTWHLMDEGLDTGAILKQQMVSIKNDETSFSLNLKCFEAALETFDSLLRELIAGTAQPKPQSLSGRSYFARNKRPDTLVDWHQATDQLLRFVRAMDFGAHPNPFGPLKIRLNESFLVLKKVERSPDQAHYLPASVERITDDALWVATADGVIIVTRLETLLGQSVPVSALIQPYGLRTGQPLSIVESNTRQLLHHLQKQCYPHQPYWEEKILASQPTPLPFDPLPAAAPPVQEPRSVLDFSVSSAINSWLADVVLEADRSTGLLGALLVCLARLNGQRQTIVGFQSETLKQLGLDSGHVYADYVPFRIEFDEEASFVQICELVNQEQKQIAQKITYARDWVAHQPMMKTVASPWLGDSVPILIHIPGESAKNPTTDKASLVISIPPGGPISVFFNQHQWASAQIHTLLSCWQTLLQNAFGRPHEPIKTLAILTASEQNQQLYGWNTTALSYPDDRLIHELVEEQAQQHPTAVALVCEGRQLTYDQLNRQANRLAHYLQQQGIIPGAAVGLVMDRSIELVVGLLAILKMGGLYVPLDVNTPTARLEFMLSQANVRYVLTHKRLPDQFPVDYRQIDISDLADSVFPREDTNLSMSLLPDAPAYIMFTSGSTGQPKGVRIPHRAVVRLVKQPNYVRLDSQTILLGMASVAFDASTFEWWAALANGGRLVLLADRHPSLDLINRLIQVHQVNTLFMTTALFNLWVDTGIQQLTSIRQLLTGGEVASVQHFQEAQRQLPTCQFINVYGPTENTTFSSFFPVLTDLLGKSSVPIGRPISQTQLYILDACYQPLPVGIAGELVAGGAGLALGYLYQADQIDPAFVYSPLVSGQRLYRTGDRARYLPDGNIEFLGRLDQQLKIRGHRIEPGEIEYTLRRHPSVQQAVVVVLELVPGQSHLVAYVVISEKQSPTQSEWRTFLQEWLPDYLIPTTFITLPSLPLKASGKVDKASLPPPSRLPKRGLNDQFLTPTQQVLSELWFSVLAERPTESTDDFFAFGGTSLLAIRLQSSLQAEFGIQLSLRDLFIHPTLESMASLIDNTRSILPQLPVSPTVIESTAFIPVSSPQKRLWILHRLYDLQGTYNIPIALRLMGTLDIESLEQSVTSLVERHQVLRTTIVERDGLPVQQIKSVPSLRIPVITLEDEPFPPGQDPLIAWLTREAYQPFTASDELLFRIRVAHLSSQESVLLLVVHHSIFDGWSIELLSHELSVFYNAAIKASSVCLPDLLAQYADFARWQFQVRLTETYQAQLRYWTHQLADMAPQLPLPIDHPRPAIPTFAGADYDFSIPTSVWQALKSLPPTSGVTPLMQLLTVFAIVLSEHAQTNDIVIGIPIAGRSQQEWQSLIGFFVNTVVIRLALDESQTFEQLLARTREVALDAFANADVPFEQLVEVMNPPRTLAYAPLVQVMMAIEEQNTHRWSLSGLQIQPLTVPQRSAKFDLNLVFRELPTGLSGTLTYNTDLFLAGTIEQLAFRYQELAGLLITQSASPIRQFLTRQNRSANPSLVVAKPIQPLQPSSADVQSTALLEQLRIIWHRLLQLDEIEDNQSFFDVGGHSLLAIQLVSEIHQIIGWPVPVSVAFANPTLQTMAAYLLTAEQSRVWRSLVAIQPHGGRTPFYCIHPVHGEVTYVYKLLPYLTLDQPVYGFQAIGLNEEAPLSSIEAMASHYLSLLLVHQPIGPYQLGGFSLGGVIAYEMAVQLNRLGKKVALLVLFDTYALTPNQWGNLELPVRTMMRSYLNFARRMPKRPADLAVLLTEKLPAVSRYLGKRLRNAILVKRALPPAMESPLLKSASAQDRLAKVHMQAYNSYQFPSYEGKVVFFRATENKGPTRYLKNYDGGWSRYVSGGIDVFPIGSHHDALFTTPEHIRFIAEKLEVYLSQTPVCQ